MHSDQPVLGRMEHDRLLLDLRTVFPRQDSALVESIAARSAVPDRAATLRVFASDARGGHRRAPGLGSAARVWLLFGGSHWVESPAYDETVRGRVKRLSDLPFHDQLTEHLARIQLPRALDERAALAALAGGN